MSDTFSQIEVISGVARRRHFSTELKLAVVAETMQPGMSIGYVARRYGFSPSLVFPGCPRVRLLEMARSCASPSPRLP
jgi:transposase